MNDYHRRRIERLKSSSAYVHANGEDFPEGSKGAQALAELDAAIVEAETYAVSREVSRNALQQATAVRGDVREAIRAGLRTMKNTMHTIALDHPEHKGSFTFKDVSVSDRTLHATAQAAATAAGPLKALFDEYGLDADFFKEFGDNVNRFGQSMDKQTADKGGRIASNASLESALKGGEAALEKLGTAVCNKYRNDAAKLAAWERARHLERAPRSRRSNGKKNGGGEENGGGGSELPSSGQS